MLLIYCDDYFKILMSWYKTIRIFEFNIIIIVFEQPVTRRHLNSISTLFITKGHLSIICFKSIKTGKMYKIASLCRQELQRKQLQ